MGHRIGLGAVQRRFYIWLQCCCSLHCPGALCLDARSANGADESEFQLGPAVSESEGRMLFSFPYFALVLSREPLSCVKPFQLSGLAHWTGRTSRRVLAHIS